MPATTDTAYVHLDDVSYDAGSPGGRASFTGVILNADNSVRQSINYRAPFNVGDTPRDVRRTLAAIIAADFPDVDIVILGM